MSNNTKYLIAFQTWIVNSLILEGTLPPRRLKAYEGIFKFHSFSRFAGISWSLFPIVTLVSVPFCPDCIFRKMGKLPVFHYFRLPGSVWIGKERGGLARRGEGKCYCLAHATGAQAFPRKLQGTPALTTKYGLHCPQFTFHYFWDTDVLSFLTILLRKNRGSVRRN